MGSSSVLVGSVRSSIARDRSRVLRTYAIVATLVSVFTVVLILLALPGWIAAADQTASSLVLAPGLLVIGGFAIVGGLMAPLWLVTRRYPDPGSHRRREAAYGTVGYAYVGALYLALIISAPPEYLDEPGGSVGSAIQTLNGLDPLVGLVPPAVVLVALALVDRRMRR